jgi:hypothetical protein
MLSVIMYALCRDADSGCKRHSGGRLAGLK